MTKKASNPKRNGKPRRAPKSKPKAPGKGKPQEPSRAPQAEPEKAKGGRPHKLDQVVDAEGKTAEESIIRDLEVGGYIRDAAARAGVHQATVFRWIAQGEEWGDVPLDEVPADQRRYREFRDAVERARAQAVMASLAVVRRAAQGSPAEYNRKGKQIRRERAPEWTAAAWYLERTRPDEFGRRDRHELTGKDGEKLSLLELEAEVDAEDADQQA